MHWLTANGRARWTVIVVVAAGLMHVAVLSSGLAAERTPVQKQPGPMAPVAGAGQPGGRPAPEIRKEPAPPMSALPGTFVFQSWNGPYVTAVGGGGRITDAIHTVAKKIGAWEQFRLADQGDCTYTIQTVSGFYFGYAGVNMNTIDTTRRSDIKYASKFRLIMFPLL
jgi:hypothetical protein